MKEVVDPEILNKLESKKVTDPELINKLESKQKEWSGSVGHMGKRPSVSSDIASKEWGQENLSIFDKQFWKNREARIKARQRYQQSQGTKEQAEINRQKYENLQQAPKWQRKWTQTDLLDYLTRTNKEFWEMGQEQFKNVPYMSSLGPQKAIINLLSGISPESGQQLQKEAFAAGMSMPARSMGAAIEQLSMGLEGLPKLFRKPQTAIDFAEETYQHAMSRPNYQKTIFKELAPEVLTHKQTMAQQLRKLRGNNLTEIPIQRLNELTTDEIHRLGNAPMPDDVEKIAPVVNRLSERLGQDDAAKLIQQNIDKYEKLGERELVKDLSDAIYMKDKIGKYGSVTNIVNRQAIIDGTKTMGVSEAEKGMLKAQSILKKQQGLLEPSNRIFDKVPELKEMLYIPAQRAEHASKIEYATILKGLDSIRKGLFKKSSERIMTYAVSQQKGGREILNTMKKTIPELTSKEIEAYNFMRGTYENLYNRLQEARKIAGKKPFQKVDNYFTFFRQLETIKEMGFDPVHAQAGILNKFINPNTTPFQFAIKRIRSKLPIELDAYNVFKKYLHSALDHIHLSPIITKTNKLQNILKDGEKTFKLADQNPYLADFLRNWAGDLAGKKRITQLGGINLIKLDKWAAKANQNLVYSVLSWNVRSALMQPLAARNTLVEIGLPNTLKGMEMNLLSKWRKFAMKNSSVLNTRIFESGVEEAMTKAKGIARSLGNIGIKPLQYLDMETARGTWLGAFNKAVKDKFSLQKAINYADDVVIRTQGSASRLDRTPITRSPAGKALALFQTFATADYQFLKKDILGIGKTVPKAEIFKKLLTYMAVTEGANLALEAAGIDTPFPNPYQTIKESAEAGDNKAVTALKIIEDVAMVHPMLGSMKYGRTLGGSALNTLQKAYNDLKEKKELDLNDFIVDVVKVTGVPGIGAIPGLGELDRYLKIRAKGGSVWKALTGKYPDRKKKIKMRKGL